MISLNYKLTTYTHFLEELAALFYVPVTDNTLFIPEAFGNGFFKVIHLHNDVEALIYDVRLRNDILFKRERTFTEFYTLVFDDVEMRNGFSMMIGNEKMEGEIKRSTALYLTSFLYDVEYVLYKDALLRGCRVLLTEPWMQQYLQLSEKENVLEKYIGLKTSGVWYKPVDSELKDLLQDILSTEKIPLLFYQNKILRIVEKFFSWLYDEMQGLTTAGSINRSDIESAQKVEAIITNDITNPPPTIKELAREVAMSESKLKKIFKIVYGLPPYEYYQKQRMEKAKQMLMTRNYTIKDVGYTLGYSNLSNFTLAFKKEFGKLPSEVVKESAK